MTSVLSVRTRLQIGLTLAGASAGAIAGAALTILGKLVAGAPPATPANYAWNVIVCGVLAAVVSPLVTWSALRRVPLWRTVTEPLVAGVGGATVGVLLGSGPAFLMLTPAAIAAAMLRLSRRYREHAPPRRILDGGASPAAG